MDAGKSEDLLCEQEAGDRVSPWYKFQSQGRQAAGWRTNVSAWVWRQKKSQWCPSSKAVKQWSWPLLVGGSVIMPSAGLQLIGRGPPTRVVGWGWSALLSPPVPMLTSSRSALSETPRNNVWPHVWTACGPVKLKHKINPHTFSVILGFKIIFCDSMVGKAGITASRPWSSSCCWWFLSSPVGNCQGS